MSQILVRQLSDEINRALKAKADELGQSAESIARQILTSNLMPNDRQRLGDQFAETWEGADLSGVTFERDQMPYRPPKFE